MIARDHEVHLVCPRGAASTTRRWRGVPVTALPIARKEPQGVRAAFARSQAHPLRRDQQPVPPTLAGGAGLRPARRRANGGAHPPYLGTGADNAAALALHARGAAHRHHRRGPELQLARDNGFAPGAHGVDSHRHRPLDRFRPPARPTTNVPRAAAGVAARRPSWSASLPPCAAGRPPLPGRGDGARGPGRHALDRRRRAAARGAANPRCATGPRGAGEVRRQPGDVLPWLRSMDVFACLRANEGVPQAILRRPSPARCRHHHRRRRDRRRWP